MGVSHKDWNYARVGSFLRRSPGRHSSVVRWNDVRFRPQCCCVISRIRTALAKLMSLHEILSHGGASSCTWGSAWHFVLNHRSNYITGFWYGVQASGQLDVTPVVKTSRWVGLSIGAAGSILQYRKVLTGRKERNM